MAIFRRMLKRTRLARLLLAAAFATSLSGTAATGTELPLHDITPTSVQRFVEAAITDETIGFRYADPPEPLSPDDLRSQLLELEPGEQSEVVYYQRGKHAWVLLQGYNAASLLCEFGEDRTLRSCYVIESRHVGPSCRPVTEISSRILIECDLILGTGTGWFSQGIAIFEVQESLVPHGIVDYYEYLSGWGDWTNGGTLYFHAELSWLSFPMK